MATPLHSTANYTNWLASSNMCHLTPIAISPRMTAIQTTNPATRSQWGMNITQDPANA